MADCLAYPDLRQFCEFISSQMGLHFPLERWPDIQRGLRSAAPDFGFSDPETCMRWLMAAHLTRRQIEILASHLTIGETCFFREKPIFKALEEHVLRELIHSRSETDRRLRIWSAGCATGEEAYSIAILLESLISPLPDWKLTVLATDINPRSLEKAAAGLYKEWSFRSSPAGLQEKYFTSLKDNRYKIKPALRQMVRFSYLNLAEDSYPSLLNDTNAMDLILCKNVLMYFDPLRQKQVIRKLYNSLVDNGWLIVSPCETSQLLFQQFGTVNFPGATFYRKDSRRAVLEYASEPPVPLSSFTPQAWQPAETPPWHFEPATPEPAPRPEPEAGSAKPAGQPSPAAEPAPAPLQQALELYARGLYAETVERLAGAAGMDSEGLRLIVRAYANQGKLAEALQWCEKMLAADKLDPRSYYLQATVLQEDGRTGEAVASLKKALYLDPDFVLAHFALGNLSSRLGKAAESGKYFRNARLLAQKRPQTEILPESDGVTAGRISEIISRMV